MKQLFYILFGWALTVIVSWCSGKLLFRRLSLRFYRHEEDVFAFLAGSACLSTAVFLLASLHLANKAAFLALSVAVIALAFRLRAWRPPAEPLPPAPLSWKLLFLGLWLLFGGVYFLYALAPEVSPDGAAYHLALVARYARERGLSAITNNVFASLPQGMEMLFLFAFVWGRHPAAALVDCTYLLVLPWLIWNYGRRIGMPAVGAAGGLLIFLAPVAAIAGSSAYNDVAVATVAFAVFALLEIWRDQRQISMLIPIGLLAGFAFAIKYTGFIAALYAAGVVAFTVWRSRKPVLRPVLLVTLSAAVLIMPTLVKNWIVVRNPVAPFFNRVFPNPYVHVSFEESLSRDMRSYEIHSPWQLAHRTTTDGLGMGGMLGPVFLLAPLSLVALRCAPGRRLLLAALVFLLPYPSNLGTRFLLPAASFLAPAIAMGLGSSPRLAGLASLHGFISWPARFGWRSGSAAWRLRPVSIRLGLGTGSVLALVVLLHALLSWPAHIGWYSHPYAWRISEIPVRTALRLEPEQEYLTRWLGDGYRMVRFIDSATPPGSRIFSLEVPPAAYCSREILPWFYSASNERLYDVLLTGFIPPAQPIRILTFRISPQTFTGLRLFETGSTAPVTPSINELRIFGPSGELQPGPAWHVDARPFPWDAALALDRNPATRWNAWQQTRSGAWISIQFGTAEKVSAVRLELTPDQEPIQWELQSETGAGKWTSLPATVEQNTLPAPLDLRKAAIEEFKRNNMRYLLVAPPYSETEFREHALEWGLLPLAQFGPSRLYQIE